jgi:16S rRNA (cytosine967-C5)-methyltransferase
MLRLAPQDLPVMAARQQRMLASVAPLLLPGGALTYSVCTFARAECEAVVDAFLREHPAFRLERTLRTWPHRDGADAFFAARLVLAGC